MSEPRKHVQEGGEPEPRNCEGAQTADGRPDCTGPNVRLSAFRTEARGPWYLAHWCDECRAVARVEMGYIVMTWSPLLFRCSDCTRMCHASDEAIAATRDAMMAPGEEADFTDEKIATSFEFCMSCLQGEEIPGERVVYFGPYRLALTAAEVAVILAALDVAGEGADERWEHLQSAVSKFTLALAAITAPLPLGVSDQRAQQLARAFASKVRRDLGEAAVREVNRRNATDFRNSNVCATHDTADANEWMGEAFAEVVGHPARPDSDDDGALWNAAWTIAREHGFYIDE